MERAEQLRIISQVIRELQEENGAWVELARMGTPLKSSGLDFKALGHEKLRPYLEQFSNELVFQKDDAAYPPVFYVKFKTGEAAGTAAPEPPTPEQEKPETPARAPAIKNIDFQKLFDLNLGYIGNKDSAVKALQRIASGIVNFNDVIDTIAKEVEQGNIIYWAQSSAGATKHATVPDNVAIKMIATPCTDAQGNKIYAYFMYNPHRKSWTGIYFQSEVHIRNRVSSHNIGKLLFKSWQDADAFIKKVHGDEDKRRLLPGEEWTFGGDEEHKTAYPILESYLKHYTVKLFNETSEEGNMNYGNVLFTEDKSKCLFNTGLLDTYANEIFIYGDAYYGANNFLIGVRNPVCETSARKLEQIGFENPTPNMLKFFEFVDELVYDPKIKVDFSDSEKLTHIIEDNIRRFPEDVQKQIEKGRFQQVAATLKSAAEAAEKIAARNYKYVVPQWRPQEKKIQFLMPIYLDLEYASSPDFALVLNREGNYYIPETILTLSMAYTNARLLCKPDDTWLQPTHIEAIEDSEEETDEY